MNEESDSELIRVFKTVDEQVIREILNHFINVWNNFMFKIVDASNFSFYCSVF